MSFWLVTLAAYLGGVAAIVTMNLARAFITPILLRHQPHRERDRRNPDPLTAPPPLIPTTIRSKKP